MRNILIYLLAALTAALSTGCGHSDSFRIEGTIEGKPTINLRIMYVGPQGIRTAITASRDGEFAFEGSSPRPVMVEIYDNEYRLLGRAIASDGEDIRLTLDRSNPYNIKATGNELSQQWADALRSMADKLYGATPAQRNSAVGAYVAANTGSPVSALLMMTEYDASGDYAVEADSLAGLIDPEARMGGITAGFLESLDHVSSATSHAPLSPIPYLVSGNGRKVFKPSDARLSLLALAADGNGRDSVVAALRAVSRHISHGRLQVVELSMATDTGAWRRSVTADTATWQQGWVGGSIASGALDGAGIPTLPYFIVTDSAGNQLWRGRSAGQARSFVIQHL